MEDKIVFEDVKVKAIEVKYAGVKLYYDALKEHDYDIEEAVEALEEYSPELQDVFRFIENNAVYAVYDNAFILAYIPLEVMETGKFNECGEFSEIKKTVYAVDGNCDNFRRGAYCQWIYTDDWKKIYLLSHVVLDWTGASIGTEFKGKYSDFNDLTQDELIMIVSNADMDI